MREYREVEQMHMIFNDKDIAELLRVYNNQTYVCSQCKRIIFPQVTMVGDNTLSIDSDFHQVRGGKGNRLVADCVCKKCAERMRWNDDGGI